MLFLCGCLAATSDIRVTQRLSAEHGKILWQSFTYSSQPSKLVCQQVTVRLPPGYRPGAVMLEVLRGGFVSDPRPVLVLESAAAVADIERLDVANFEGALLLGPRCAIGVPRQQVTQQLVGALPGRTCTSVSACTAIRHWQQTQWQLAGTEGLEQTALVVTEGWHQWG